MPSRFDSPAHADDRTLDVLKILRAGDFVPRERAFATFQPTAAVAEIVRVVSGASWQDVFPVLDEGGRMVGLLSADAIRTLIAEKELEGVAVAADVMGPALTVSTDEDLHVVLERLLEAGMRELPVVAEDGSIVGLLDEADIVRAYHLEVTRRREEGDAATASAPTAPPAH
jgi:CIC family chloride channel protein